ncbi:MAG: YnbE family lipoprotein [Erythrobacter sp.]|nr:YnbE family lipoprotein [Erythrobacter sp.]
MKLTARAADASFPRGTGKGTRLSGQIRLLAAGFLVLGSASLGGCINVAAPDEPIVIELNINIRQEVVYRLAEDAADTIEENADIF